MGLLDDILIRQPSGYIYHYTSQTGLLGILKNKCVWATNTHYQNDSKEFQHALELSKGAIEVLRNHNPPTEEERLLRAMKRTLNSIQGVNIFVSSFSEHKDMLSQWRGYCPHGNGFSIGFDYVQLKTIVGTQGFGLVPCVYDPSEQYQLVTELINETLSAFRVDLANSVPIKHALRSRSNEYMNRMFTLAPIIKHSTFSEESEWRAVSFPTSSNHPQVTYREGRSMLTPYFVLNLAVGGANLPIREVVVGPTPHMNLASSSVSSILSANKITGGSVMPSSIPYRGW